MNYNSIIIKIMNNGTRKKINKEFNDLTEAKCEAYLELSKVSKIENLDKVKSIILDNDLNVVFHEIVGESIFDIKVNND